MIFNQFIPSESKPGCGFRKNSVRKYIRPLPIRCMTRILETAIFIVKIRFVSNFVHDFIEGLLGWIVLSIIVSDLPSVRQRPEMNRL